MYNNAGLKSSKGTGISGFLERNKAYGAIRTQYNFNAATSSKRLSAAAQRALMQPREAAKAYVASALSSAEADALSEQLEEHIKLREVKLAVTNLRKKLRSEAKVLDAATEGRIEEALRRHHQDLLEQYIADAEARANANAAAAKDDGAGTGNGAKMGTKSARAFAEAFGVKRAGVASSSAPAGGDDVEEDDQAENSAWTFEGSSFDRRRQTEAKARAEAAYRERREQQAAQQVMERGQREIDALRNQGPGAKRERQDE